MAEFKIEYIDTTTEVSDQDLQGIVDLQTKNDHLNDEQRAERGFGSVENLRQMIAHGTQFIIAKNKENRVLGSQNIDDVSDNNAWISSVIVDPEFRGKGISSAMQQELIRRKKDLANQTKTSITIACGVEFGNTDSEKIHEKWGYKKGHTFSGERADEGNQYHLYQKEIKPENRIKRFLRRI